MKNIIDKLANFVARNGPQFEEMTKQKQKDNPKFSFLFGGEFYTYYKFRVASEIARKLYSPNFTFIFPQPVLFHLLDFSLLISHSCCIFLNFQNRTFTKYNILVLQVQ